MRNSVTLIVAAVLGALLSAGCSKALNPASEQSESIRFEAGSLLLDDYAPTKSGAIKEAFDQASDDVGLSNADRFFVWGAKSLPSGRTTVFNGDAVYLQSLGADPNNPADDIWTYSPLRFWDSGATQYDFVAISGPESSADFTSDLTVPASGNLSLAVTYNPTVKQYDLTAAAGQRKENSSTHELSTVAVSLQFYHILSAVSVVIYNDSPNTPIKLKSFGFRNICTAATAHISQYGNGLQALSGGTWSGHQHDANIILGQTYQSPDYATISTGNHYPVTEVIDLMTPQSLATVGNYIPQLVLSYCYDEVDDLTVPPTTNTINVDNTAIRLANIKFKGSDEYITEWLPGQRYNYEIHIRLGGGIIVSVSTKAWEDVPAQTPGLTIG